MTRMDMAVETAAGSTPQDPDARATARAYAKVFWRLVPS